MIFRVKNDPNEVEGNILSMPHHFALNSLFHSARQSEHYDCGRTFGYLHDQPDEYENNIIMNSN